MGVSAGCPQHKHRFLSKDGMRRVFHHKTSSGHGRTADVQYTKTYQGSSYGIRKRRSRHSRPPPHYRR